MWRDVFLFSKIWHVLKFLNQNLLFKSSFQILAEILSKSKNNLLDNDVGLEWKKISRVCGMCLSLTFGTIILVIAIFMALGFLMGKTILSIALPIDFYKSFWKTQSGWCTKNLF